MGNTAHKQRQRLSARQEAYEKSKKANHHSFDTHKPGSQNRNKK